VGDWNTAPRFPAAGRSDDTPRASLAFPREGSKGALRRRPPRRQRGRVLAHCLVLVVALAAILLATRQPTTGSAGQTLPVPSFAYSGVAGAVQISANDTYLRPGSSLKTFDSVAIRTRPLDSASLRATGGVAPTSTLSSGVSAAAAHTREGAVGVTALAEIVDPQTPFAVWVTRPGDSISEIAERFGVEESTILENNPTVTDRNVVQQGLELIVPRADGILHKVAFDETLRDIIDQYDNITFETATNFRSNAIADPDNLEPGSYVLLPGASIKPPPPPEPDPPPLRPGSPGQPTPAGDGRFSSPLAAYSRVTDEFGTIRAIRGGNIHTGIDLGLFGFQGSTIYAACDGVVNRTEWLTWGYGYYVTIDCGGGYSTLYAHMGRIDVSVGQRVTRGTPLGISGLTGLTTGEHLHFEIRLNGAPVNPRRYINF
jgi:murein DD-endopeptidase MepM/ murein hydrolase activator NlpD